MPQKENKITSLVGVTCGLPVFPEGDDSFILQIIYTNHGI
jgi:hypothetical protein